MDSLYSVKLGKLIREFRLEVLRGAAGYEDRPIRTENVNRPGLQLTGFFDYFDPDHRPGGGHLPVRPDGGAAAGQL